MRALPTVNHLFAAFALGGFVVGSVQANSTNFDYKILAQTGQAGLTGIKSGPSLNDSGHVGFIGQISGGEGVFFANGQTVVNLSPSYSSRTFSTSFQLNNADDIVARDSGGGVFHISFWRASAPNSPNDIISTSGLRQSYCTGGFTAGQPCTGPFDCVEVLPDGSVIYWPCAQPPQTHYIGLLFPTVNNINEVAYIGGITSTTSNALAISSSFGSYEYLLPGASKLMRSPMIADNGRIVARAGSSSGDPIWMFERRLTNYVEVASFAEGFSTLGALPGINDSGTAIVFYGDLTDSAKAAQYGTTTGPGIFTFFPNGSNYVRLSSLKTSDPNDTNIVAGYSADDRVNINNRGYVVFLGSNTNGQKVLFRNKVNLTRSSADAKRTQEVIKVGDSIDGLAGSVADLGVWDSINNSPYPGQISCSVTMSDGTRAVLLIQDRCIGSRMTMHQAGSAALQFSETDGVDDPLLIKPDFSPLFNQPLVTNGLVADGVTPLLLRFSLTNPPTADVEVKIRLEIDTSTGDLASPVEDDLYVFDGSSFVHGNSITVSPSRPTNFLYISGIRSEDVTFGPGSRELSLYASFDYTGTSGCPHEIKIAKPPIVLVHGYNSDSRTWSGEFMNELLLARNQSFVVPVEYGAIPPGNSENYLNTYGGLRLLGGVLSAKLAQAIEPLNAELHTSWAFTRYDVVGHSQGGVLARLLCSTQADAVGQWPAFRSPSNYYRGRFHRVVTIGSPHNGTTEVYYGLRLLAIKDAGGSLGIKALQVLKSLKPLMQPKFDPFSGEIVQVNQIPIDQVAKFHVIRTRLADCFPLAKVLFICDDCRGVPRSTIIFPAGTDGVVDFDSEGGGFSPPAIPYTDITQAGISHSDGRRSDWKARLAGLTDPFGVGSSYQTGTRLVAQEVIRLLNGSPSAFGSFPTPPFVQTQAQIDSCLPLLGPSRGVISPAPSPAPAVSSSSLDYVLVPSADAPLQGEVVWFVENFGTNGLSIDGVSLQVSTNDSTRVSLLLDDAVQGYVVLYASYTSTNGLLVPANPLVVLSRPPGDKLDHVELVPSQQTLAAGQTLLPELWGVYTNGTRSLLYTALSGTNVFSSSNPSVISVEDDRQIRANYAGTAVITAVYQGFSAQAMISVFSSDGRWRIAPLPLSSNGYFGFQIIGPPGGAYQVQASTNLINWVTMTNVVSMSGVASVTVPRATSQSTQGFFRAALTP